MDPGGEYNVRLRLIMGDEAGPYGEEELVEMPSEPHSGADLHKAIKMEDIEGLKKILEENKNSKNIELVDSTGFTPLMVAGNRNLKDITNMLLKYGADPNTQNSLGKTALMLAANKGNLEICEMMIKSGAKVNLKDSNGMHSVFYAVDGEQANTVRFLSKSGANINQEDKGNKWTPLIRLACLANNGNARVGTALLDCGASVNIQDKRGQTALFHCAFHRNHLELAKVLLSHGANPDLRNTDGLKAVDIARTQNNINFCNMIEKHVRTGGK